jgi:hypothetical protein
MGAVITAVSSITMPTIGVDLEHVNGVYGKRRSRKNVRRM